MITRKMLDIIRVKAKIRAERIKENFQRAMEDYALYNQEFGFEQGQYQGDTPIQNFGEKPKSPI